MYDYQLSRQSSGGMIHLNPARRGWFEGPLRQFRALTGPIWGSLGGCPGPQGFPKARGLVSPYIEHVPSRAPKGLLS